MEGGKKAEAEYTPHVVACDQGGARMRVTSVCKAPHPLCDGGCKNSCLEVLKKWQVQMVAALASRFRVEGVNPHFRIQVFCIPFKASPSRGSATNSVKHRVADNLFEQHIGSKLSLWLRGKPPLLSVIEWLLTHHHVVAACDAAAALLPPPPPPPVIAADEHRLLVGFQRRCFL